MKAAQTPTGCGSRIGARSRPRRNHSPIDAAALLGVPFRVIGCGYDLIAGLGNRLALIEGQMTRNPVRSLPDQFGDSPQDAAALQRRGPAPRLEAASGRGKRVIKIALRRMRQMSENIARRRIVNRLALTVTDEASVDV